MTLLFTHALNPPQTLPGPVATGDTTLALPSASSFFAPGDILFVADADATNAEYLGAVSAADTSSLTFTLPAQTARPAGASLFSPINVIRTTGRLNPPLQRTFQSGVHTQRTLGGQVVAIRTAQPAAQIELTIAGLTPHEEEQLVNDLNAATDNLRLPFTMISSSRRILALQLAAPQLNRNAAPGGRRSVAFTAFGLGEDRLV